MISIPQHFASWSLRALCLPLIAKVLWLVPIAWEGTHHAPRSSGILLVTLLLLILGWAGLFWRRGTQLTETKTPFPIAFVWLSLRAFFDALGAAIFAIGLACCLLVLFGGPTAQESVLHISLGSHISETSPVLNAMANWVFHSSIGTFFYAAGLRLDDGFDQLKASGKKGPHTAHLISLLCAFLLTSGCVDPAEQAPPGTLVVSQEQAASWSRNFNPLLPSGTARWAATACIYEPLMIFNTVTQEWVPRLASEFHWVEEGTVLALKIRPGVRWSDGTAFSTQDVLYTFSLLKEVPILDSRDVWSFIESIEPQEDGWIHFRFQRPYVPGLAHIGHQLIVPEHIFSKVEQPETFSNPDPVGTGPFTEILKFDQQVWDLGRNPFFWQEGKPMVETLRFPAFPDNDQANVALIRGEVDWAGTFVPAIDRIYVDRDPDHHHYWFPLISSTIFLYANTQHEILSDPRVRKALSYAIDRERVTRVGMYEYTQAASPTGLSMAHNKWIDQSLEASNDWTQYRPDRAVELLEEAGLKRDSKGRWRDANNELFSFELTVPAGWSDWVRSCQVMVQGFKEIGIEVRLVTRDFGAWLYSVQHGDFDLAMGWSQSGVTPYEFFKGLMSTETVQPVGELAGSNWHRFGLPAVDKLLTTFEGISDPSEQSAIMNQLQALFAQEVPAIPLFPGPAWGAYNDKRFTGFPSAENPYAVLSPNRPPESLLVLTELKPR